MTRTEIEAKFSDLNFLKDNECGSCSKSEHCGAGLYFCHALKRIGGPHLRSHNDKCQVTVVEGYRKLFYLDDDTFKKYLAWLEIKAGK